MHTRRLNTDNQSGRDRELTAHDAAATLFGVEQVTERQLNQVRLMIAKRILKPFRNGTLTTSASEVARYLARQDLDLAAIRATDRDEDHRSVAKTYQQFAMDYFLAVTLRKRRSSNHRFFDRAVVTGQIVLLIGIALAFLQLAIGFKTKLGGDHAAIRQYLSTKHTNFEVTNITKTLANSSSNSPAMVRVRYRYFTPKGKSIESERYLALSQGRVVEEQQID